MKNYLLIRLGELLSRRKQANVKKTSVEVDQWVAYINGNGTKPKPRAPTLISNSRPERAANKPLVNGIIEGMETKIFFDTGAEINVIDEVFFQRLQKKNPRLKVEPVNSFIRCANDSRMKALGKVQLNIFLQGILTNQTFTIVRGIFPKIIIGIRQMKRCDIVVDPMNDCIWFKNRPIPFVSKVMLPKDQENCSQLTQ